MSNGFGPIKIFASNSGRELAAKICQCLSVDLGEARVGRFNDGEVDVQIKENIRDMDVFIVADIHGPADNLMETVHLAEAARGSSAGRVTLVISKFGYDRSDRKDKPRKPIGVKIAIKMLESAYPDRVIVLDIHAEQSLGLFDRVVHDHLYGTPVAVAHLRQLLVKPFVVASPDRGGVPRAEKYANLLGRNQNIVVFSKTREAPGKIAKGSIKILGSVRSKAVVFVDDMIDTGGTIVADAAAAKAAGARQVFVFATHGVFSQEAMGKIRTSKIDKVFVTDSIYQDPKRLKKAGGKVVVLSVAPLLARAIRRTHEGESLSELVP